MGDVFLVNGRKRHWQVAEAAGIWGFVLGHADPQTLIKKLHGHGFHDATPFAAILGPRTRFRGRVRGDLYVDQTPLWPAQPDGEIFPIRFAFETMELGESNWFRSGQDGDSDWREVLRDLHAWSLCLLTEAMQADHRVLKEVVSIRSPS